MTNKNVSYFNPYENKEVILESTWEITIADFLCDNDVRWTRPPHVKWIDSTGRTKKYFADFYLPDYDIYLDPKNDQVIRIQREKLKIVSKIIKLIYGQPEYIKEQIISLKEGRDVNYKRPLSYSNQDILENLKDGVWRPSIKNADILKTLSKNWTPREKSSLGLAHMTSGSYKGIDFKKSESEAIELFCETLEHDIHISQYYVGMFNYTKHPDSRFKKGKKYGLNLIKKSAKQGFSPANKYLKEIEAKSFRHKIKKLLSTRIRIKFKIKITQSKY